MIKNSSHKTLWVLLVISCSIFYSCENEIPKNWQWQILETTNKPVARHEAGLIAFKNKIYLIGGRRVNPTSVFDPSNNTWTNASEPPLEIHHFQPVVYKDGIYIVGAMTGKWPNEKPIDRILIYYPDKDVFEYGDPIPQHRRRGGSGVVVYNNKIYMLGGITHGHMNGSKAWFDEYNPETGEWKALDSAPNARDHFQAVVSNNKLYAFAGRKTSKKTNQDIDLTTSHGNIYNFQSKTWETVKSLSSIPTERAGNAVFSWNDEIVIGGGESIGQEKAHNELESFSIKSNLWSQWPKLNQGRHGTGFAIIGNYVYTASGCGNRGGEPELTSIERLELPKKGIKSNSEVVDETPVFQKWHTIELAFTGPESSETAAQNPFLNHKLVVNFKHEDTIQTIRGFYAADGNAAETSSTKGNQWKVRFKPNKAGKWSYNATLYRGDSIAIKDSLKDTKTINISNSENDFIVIDSDKEGNDFRANGRLGVANGYFKFQNSDEYWLKVGANSPENLLGYVDFDDTYRIKTQKRDGEATAPETIHEFKPHIKDWKSGDPTWKNGKGKSLIGAINYLATAGMNSDYFLTLNVLGDGKDVWPYNNPNDFTRFDVSKLAQWEIVFQHMQSKGILLHIVLQETENETLLDNGNMGPLRQLYFHEMIARFGHHLGLIWNLGEENGPAEWSPIGQNDMQRKAMASFITKNDPYNHPILLHTHAEDPLRSDILNDIVGFKAVDGLSLQQAERTEVSSTIKTWKDHSKSKEHEWLISMDEIGKWHTGAVTDKEDKNHASLRKHVLWGTLMSGGAGVEWYFGAKHPHNDLTSEDWRQRARLWELTKIVKDFFDTYLPYWEMHPDPSLINSKDAHCLIKSNEIYAAYLPYYKKYTINLKNANGNFSVKWYNPLEGGEVEYGSTEMIKGGQISSLGSPPKTKEKDQDWVVLVKRFD